MMSLVENEDNREGVGSLRTEETMNCLLREQEGERIREMQYNCQQHYMYTQIFGIEFRMQ